MYMENKWLKLVEEMSRGNIPKIQEGLLPKFQGDVNNSETKSKATVFLGDDYGDYGENMFEADFNRMEADLIKKYGEGNYQVVRAADIQNEMNNILNSGKTPVDFSIDEYNRLKKLRDDRGNLLVDQAYQTYKKNFPNDYLSQYNTLNEMYEDQSGTAEEQMKRMGHYEEYTMRPSYNAASDNDEEYIQLRDNVSDYSQNKNEYDKRQNAFKSLSSEDKLKYYKTYFENMGEGSDVYMLKHGDNMFLSKAGTLSEGTRSDFDYGSTPGKIDTFAEAMTAWGPATTGTCYMGVCNGLPGAAHIANETGMTTKAQKGNWAGYYDRSGAYGNDQTFDEQFFNPHNTDPNKSGGIYNTYTKEGDRVKTVPEHYEKLNPYFLGPDSSKWDDHWNKALGGSLPKFQTRGEKPKHLDKIDLTDINKLNSEKINSATYRERVRNEYQRAHNKTLSEEELDGIVSKLNVQLTQGENDGNTARYITKSPDPNALGFMVDGYGRIREEGMTTTPYEMNNYPNDFSKGNIYMSAYSGNNPYYTTDNTMNYRESDNFPLGQTGALDTQNSILNHETNHRLNSLRGTPLSSGADPSSDEYKQSAAYHNSFFSNADITNPYHPDFEDTEFGDYAKKPYEIKSQKAQLEQALLHAGIWDPNEGEFTQDHVDKLVDNKFTIPEKDGLDYLYTGLGINKMVNPTGITEIPINMMTDMAGDNPDNNINSNSYSAITSDGYNNYIGTDLQKDGRMNSYTTGHEAAKRRISNVPYGNEELNDWMNKQMVLNNNRRTSYSKMKDIENLLDYEVNDRLYDDDLKIFKDNGITPSGTDGNITEEDITTLNEIYLDKKNIYEDERLAAKIGEDNQPSEKGAEKARIKQKKKELKRFNDRNNMNLKDWSSVSNHRDWMSLDDKSNKYTTDMTTGHNDFISKIDSDIDAAESWMKTYGGYDNKKAWIDAGENASQFEAQKRNSVNYNADVANAYMLDNSYTPPNQHTKGWPTKKEKDQYNTNYNTAISNNVWPQNQHTQAVLSLPASQRDAMMWYYGDENKTPRTPEEFSEYYRKLKIVKSAAPNIRDYYINSNNTNNQYIDDQNEIYNENLQNIKNSNILEKKKANEKVAPNLIDFMNNVADASDEIGGDDLPPVMNAKYGGQLPKFQSEGEFVFDPSFINQGYVAQVDNTNVHTTPQIAVDNSDMIRLPNGDFIPRPIDPGTITAHEEPSIFDKVVNTVANPLAAFGYSARNEPVPWGRIPRGENNFDTFALGLVNPASWLESGQHAVNDAGEGNYGSAALNVLGATPLIPGAKAVANSRVALKTLLPKRIKVAQKTGKTSNIKTHNTSDYPTLDDLMNPNYDKGQLRKFYKRLAEGEPTHNSVRMSYIDDLDRSGPNGKMGEGFERLVNQEADALADIGYTKALIDHKAVMNALDRIDELKGMTSPNTQAKHSMQNNATNMLEANPSLYNNAYYSSPVPTAERLDADEYLKWVMELRTGSHSRPSEIALGLPFVKSKPTMAHEIGHNLQRTRELPLDKALKKNITPKTNLNRTDKKAYNYFMTGSNGKESSAFLHELREQMLINGLIKTKYQKITPGVLDKASKYYNDNPAGILIDDHAFVSNTRILDFMKPTVGNYQQLSKYMNKLPVVGGAGFLMLNEENKH